MDVLANPLSQIRPGTLQIHIWNIHVGILSITKLKRPGKLLKGLRNTLFLIIKISSFKTKNLTA